MKFFSHAAVAQRAVAGRVMGARYSVEHETRYAYAVPVAQSWQLAHLTPRSCRGSRCSRTRCRSIRRRDERHDAATASATASPISRCTGAHRLLRVRMQLRGRGG